MSASSTGAGATGTATTTTSSSTTIGQSQTAKAIAAINARQAQTLAIPEIDFTQHQLDSGEFVSTNERVVKDVSGRRWVFFFLLFFCGGGVVVEMEGSVGSLVSCWVAETREERERRGKKVKTGGNVPFGRVFPPSRSKVE
jgi:serine/threonine-protein phosphatase 2B catalytic subunit